MLFPYLQLTQQGDTGLSKRKLILMKNVNHLSSRYVEVASKCFFSMALLITLIYLNFVNTLKRRAYLMILYYYGCCKVFKVYSIYFGSVLPVFQLLDGNHSQGNQSNYADMVSTWQHKKTANKSGINLSADIALNSRP